MFLFKLFYCFQGLLFAQFYLLCWVVHFVCLYAKSVVLGGLDFGSRCVVCMFCVVGVGVLFYVFLCLRVVGFLGWFL